LWVKDKAKRWHNPYIFVVFFFFPIRLSLLDYYVNISIFTNIIIVDEM